MKKEEELSISINRKIVKLALSFMGDNKNFNDVVFSRNLSENAALYGFTEDETEYIKRIESDINL